MRTYAPSCLVLVRAIFHFVRRYNEHGTMLDAWYMPCATHQARVNSTINTTVVLLYQVYQVTRCTRQHTTMGRLSEHIFSDPSGDTHIKHNGFVVQLSFRRRIVRRIYMCTPPVVENTSFEIVRGPVSCATHGSTVSEILLNAHPRVSTIDKVGGKTRTLVRVCLLCTVRGLTRLPWMQL